MHNEVMINFLTQLAEVARIDNLKMKTIETGKIKTIWCIDSIYQIDKVAVSKKDLWQIYR